VPATKPTLTLICAENGWLEPLTKTCADFNLSTDISEAALQNSDLVILLIDCQKEIDRELIELYNFIRESYLPTVLLLHNFTNARNSNTPTQSITNQKIIKANNSDNVVDITADSLRLTNSNNLFFNEPTDYEDYLPIISRVLEDTTTRFLPLYGDLGETLALIDLQENLIHDYSGSEMKIEPASEEHLELVAEFQENYREVIEEFGESGFIEGLYPIAHPIYLSGFNQKEIGFRELIENLLPSSSEFLAHRIQ
jgi:hypothetical protein